uniref:Exosome complex component RRP45 n=1 Tax=Leptocylindrus danicus TaxID=163516 RepID=A0A7S2PLQ7_9STRA|mmetsp:Transcript_4861/g.7075  ORF Transcript_4861/g.7075 Transcript_4861/m.7075 type:complete len:527 (+) Transcript_4861:35-1615(+)
MAIRDDSTKRSLCTNERNFIRTCATNGNDILRLDGRQAGEIRKLRLTFSRSHARSECTVELGPTKCLCSIVGDLVPPNPDRTNNGLLNFQVDLSPMASLSYDAGIGSMDSDQRLLATKIGRVMERAVREGNALDTEALCVQSGKWVWRLNVDVTVLDDSGNVLDGSLLAAVAALRHFRLPEVAHVDETPIVLHSDDKEPTPLPLHHTPACISFGLFGDKTGAYDSSKVAAVLDPSDREELVMDGSITFAFNRHKELCALDFNGGCELRTSQLLACARLAETKSVELCNMLEDALKSADEKATKERLQRLKEASTVKPISVLDSTNVPFLEESDRANMEIESLEAIDEIGTALAKAAAEDEQYKAQALDYDLGHVAAKVKDAPRSGVLSSKDLQGGSLIKAMIQAAKGKGSKSDVGNDGAIVEVAGNEKKKQVEVDRLEESSSRDAIQPRAAFDHKGKSSPVDSDDEDEELTMFSSEFNTVASDQITSQSAKEKHSLADAKEEEIDDLMHAVKKSRSKKKKKKKKNL